MQIATTIPTVPTLPAPMPTSPVAPSPALRVLEQHAMTLHALGASSVDVIDATTLGVAFTNNFQAVQAAGAFRDVVDGVTLIVQNRSLTADYWTSTGANTATWLRQSPVAVENVIERETFPLQLDVLGNGMNNEYALGALLRNQLDDGTSINVVRRMYAL